MRTQFLAPAGRKTSPPPAAASPRRRRWRLLSLLLIVAIWGLLAAGLALAWFARDLPRPEDALDAVRRPSLVLRDRTGATIATFGDIVGQTLRLSQMPPALPAAAVSVEDRRFWSHHGFDAQGLLRALWVDLRGGRLVQGGSTITQQVAKTLFLSNARTLRRKVQEALLTIWLERHFTKSEILEIWLNRVYLGAGAWGVDAASQLYFGIPARRMTLWQSAMIAGLPRAPSRFNPRVDPAAAIARTRQVLDAMVESGAITRPEADRAAASIRLPPVPAAGDWFADWVATQADSVVPAGADAVLSTTLDTRLQGEVARGLQALLDGPGRRVGAEQGAVIVMDTSSGAVRAMVGGRDWRQSPYNRAVLARRQPGSVFKLFVWLAALEHGLRPDDTVLDAPLTIGGWSPGDFEMPYRGAVSLDEAFANSLNTASVRLLQRSGGVPAVTAVARRLGVTDRLPATPSLALGTGEVGLLEMAAAYASVFNDGVAVTPYGIDRVQADGTSRLATHPVQDRVLAPDISAMMVRMLADVVRNGTGRAAAVPGRFVAGKTGTTQDSRDAWFIGIVDRSVVAVWIGRDDDQPMRGVTGGSLPATLFRQIGQLLR